MLISMNIIFSHVRFSSVKSGMIDLEKNTKNCKGSVSTRLQKMWLFYIVLSRTEKSIRYIFLRYFQIWARKIGIFVYHQMTRDPP